MKYIIDSYIFSFREDMQKEELEGYLQTISDLDKWWKNHREEIYVMSNISSILFEHGFYPLKEKLAPLLKKYDSDFEYRDIQRMLNHYIEQTSFIDDICTKEYIEKTQETYKTNVDVVIADRPEAFQMSFFDLMWFVFCLHVIENNEIDSYIVFSKPIDKPILIEYNYEYINLDKDPEILMSEKSEVTITCHSSLDSFQRDRNTPFLLWRYSICKSDLDIGLRCKILQEEKLDNIEDIEKKYHFSFQDSFYKDFCDNRYANRPSDINSALDSMLKVILDIRHGKEHNMRTSMGGNAPYVFHGDYAGMRKNITTSIKLHYWKKTPYYQFAKIGEHDFFDIPWEDYNMT